MGPTGDIVDYTEILKKPVAEQKKYIPIEEKYLDEVSVMNRKDRRAWYRRNKHLLTT